MNENEKLHEQFPDVLDGLNNLAADIDRQTYPGQAWPVSRRRGLRIFFWPAVSAAASIMLSITLASYFSTMTSLPTPNHGTDSVAIDNSAEYDLHVLEMLATDYGTVSDEQLIIESDDFWMSSPQTPTTPKTPATRKSDG